MMDFTKPIIFYNKETMKFACDLSILADMSLSEEAVKEKIINLPVAVVSIAGDARKGKSFLLNYFIRYLRNYDQEDWIGDPDEPLTGFSWSDGVERNTTGIVLWPEPFILKRKDGKRIVVLLMDTQGFFDDHTDHNEMIQLYTISARCSSIQIYNQMNSLTSKHITTLSSFSEYGQKIFNKTDYKYQKLLILLRDWSHQNQFNYGFDGGLKFLNKKKFTQKLNFSDKWSTLDACYSDIGCFLMPSPGDKSEEIGFNGEISKLKPDFIKYLKELVPSLLSPEKIVIKSWEDKELKLWKLSNFFANLALKLQHYSSLNIQIISIMDQETRADNAFRMARCWYIKAVRHAYDTNKKKTHDFNRAETVALITLDAATKILHPNYRERARKDLEQFFIQFRTDFAASEQSPKWWEKISKSVENNLLHFKLLVRIESKERSNSSEKFRGFFNSLSRSKKSN